MQLSDFLWRRIVDSLYQINLAQNAEEIQRIALDCISDLIPGSETVFALLEKSADGRFRYSGMQYVGEKPLFWDMFNELDLRFDPHYRGVSSSQLTQVFRASDALSDEDRRQSPTYKLVYEPSGYEYGLHAILRHQSEEVGEIDIHRKVQEGDFTATDLEVLSVMSPHIALRLGQVLAENAASSGGSDNATPNTAEERHLDPLTQREREVLELAAEGLSDIQIAGKLFIAKSTVKKHIHNGYVKLGVRNRVQLRKALRE